MIGFIKFLFVVIVVAVGLAFHIKNDTAVAINYYLGTFDTSLSVVVIVSILVGVILGWLTSLTMMIPIRRDRSKLRKQVKTVEQEVSNLRSIPLQDGD